MPDFVQTATHLISNYGYFGLFISLALGILGLPVPDETILTFSGFMVSEGRFSLLSSILISVLGSLSGMSLSYFIGNKVGRPFIIKYGKYIHITPELFERGESLFARYREKSIIIGYFIPGVRHLTAYLSGMGKLNYLSFILFAFVGALSWIFVFISIGRSVGANWELFGRLIHHYLYILLILLVLSCILIYSLKNYKKLKGID